MWNTSASGITTLSGKFRELVLRAAVDEIEFLLDVCDPHDGKRPAAGRAYRKLSDREQAYAMATVARCLTTDCPAPELLHWNESAVFALFTLIEQRVIVEINGEGHEEDRYYWRRLVAEAEREAVDYGSDEYVNVKSNNKQDWGAAIESLESQVLWDADHEQACADRFLKKHASEATAAGQMFGISNAYYTTPIPEVTDERLKEAEDFLNSAEVLQ